MPAGFDFWRIEELIGALDDEERRRLAVIPYTTAAHLWLCGSRVTTRPRSRSCLTVEQIS
nr:hypothetical protein GCM10020063_090860 [Dactylosporangium thailandense]